MGRPAEQEATRFLILSTRRCRPDACLPAAITRIRVLPIRNRGMTTLPRATRPMPVPSVTAQTLEVATVPPAAHATNSSQREPSPCPDSAFPVMVARRTGRPCQMSPVHMPFIWHCQSFMIIVRPVTVAAASAAVFTRCTTAAAYLLSAFCPLSPQKPERLLSLYQLQPAPTSNVMAARRPRHGEVLFRSAVSPATLPARPSTTAITAANILITLPMDWPAVTAMIWQSWRRGTSVIYHRQRSTRQLPARSGAICSTVSRPAHRQRFLPAIRSACATRICLLCRRDGSCRNVLHERHNRR